MEGLIYKVIKYRENSKILHVFTAKRKITLVASGALKMNSPSRNIAQYMNLISFEDSERDIFTLKNGQIINDYKQIKDDYELLKYASRILEVIDKVIVDDEIINKVYDEALIALSGDIKITSLSFMIRVLFYLGLGPNVSGDGRKVKGLNIESGNLVYENEHLPCDLNYDETVIFLKLCANKLSEIVIPEENYQKLIYFLEKYYQYHLQTQLKTLK